jgi:cell division protein FtsI (penicillin-binding protein 3)
LQDVSETALHKAMMQHNADDGLVWCMDVKTGEVKAISNLSSNGQAEFSEKFNLQQDKYSNQDRHSSWYTMIALLEDSPVELTDS